MSTKNLANFEHEFTLVAVREIELVVRPWLRIAKRRHYRLITDKHLYCSRYKKLIFKNK